MMFERFTGAAREVVTGARQQAESLGHRYIGTEHLLLAMCEQPAGLAHGVLAGAGIGPDQVRAGIRRLVGPPAPPLDADDAAALRTVGIDLDAVLARIQENFGPGGTDRPGEASGDPDRRSRPGGLGLWIGPRFSGRAKKVIGLALREAIHLRHNHIGTEHILLGLIREGEGLAALILTNAGIDLRDLRTRTLAALDRAA